jgi:hypothetical protein
MYAFKWLPCDLIYYEKETIEINALKRFTNTNTKGEIKGLPEFKFIFK